MSPNLPRVTHGVRQRASTLAALGAVAVAVFWGGGFDAAPQWLFAGLALLAALLAPPRRVTLPAAVLLALAARRSALGRLDDRDAG